MAKEQNLSLNPAKISGMCGRLMCCLKHEEDTYEYLNRQCPAIGDFVKTKDGFSGEVMNVNVLRQLVKVLINKGDEKELQEYPLEELEFKKRVRRERSKADEIADNELIKLEQLTQRDNRSKLNDTE